MSPNHDTDPVALADRDVRRLLPPSCGLQEPASLRPRLAVLLETLYGRVLAAEADAARAHHMVKGHEKTYALLLAGMESSEEQRTALKLRVRELVCLDRIVEAKNDRIDRIVEAKNETVRENNALRARIRELEAARVPP